MLNNDISQQHPIQSQFRFQACQRLLKRHEFQAVFDKPLVRSSDRYFTFLALPNQQMQGRLGLVIMKKRVKLAVQRNRIKRLTRESFRQHAQCVQGLDIILLVRDGIDVVDNPHLFSALKYHWRRIAKRIQAHQSSLTHSATETKNNG